MSCFLKCFLDGVCVIDAGIGLDLFVGSFSGVFFLWIGWKCGWICKRFDFEMWVLIFLWIRSFSLRDPHLFVEL